MRTGVVSGLHANGRVEANRVTEAVKPSLSIGENYIESRFNSNGENSIVIQRSYSANIGVTSLGIVATEGAT